MDYIELLLLTQRHDDLSNPKTWRKKSTTGAQHKLKLKLPLMKNSGNIFCGPKNSTSTTKYEYKNVNSKAQKTKHQGHAILTFLLTWKLCFWEFKVLILISTVASEPSPETWLVLEPSLEYSFVIVPQQLPKL